MIQEIEKIISDILRDNKALSNQFEEEQRKGDLYTDEVFLDVLSILDTFTREEKIIVEHEWNRSEDSGKAIRRFLNVKRRLISLLEKHNVIKISFQEGMSIDDYCIITDTEPNPEKPDGFILSIEKDGFTRNGHLLRRAEVIIVKN